MAFVCTENTCIPSSTKGTMNGQTHSSGEYEAVSCKNEGKYTFCEIGLCTEEEEKEEDGENGVWVIVAVYFAYFESFIVFVGHLMSIKRLITAVFGSYQQF